MNSRAIDNTWNLLFLLQRPQCKLGSAGKLTATHRSWRLTLTDPSARAWPAVCTPQALSLASHQGTGTSTEPRRGEGQRQSRASNQRAAEAALHTTSPASAATESLDTWYSSEETFRKLNLEFHVYTSLPKWKAPGGQQSRSLIRKPPQMPSLAPSWS